MSQKPAVLACVFLLAALAFAPEARAEQHVRVPHVVGLDVDEAVGRLAAVGLESRITWEAGLPAGRVARQEPGMNARARLGSTVHLVAGLRVQIETIVPDVTGLAVEEAVAALEPVYEVQLSDVSVRGPLVGRIVTQQPLAGARLAYRGVLQLQVGIDRHERGETEVPALEGLALAEAERTLLDVGLVPHPRFVFRGHHGRPGPQDATGLGRHRVLAQDPAAGARVAPGSEIQVRVPLSRLPSSRVRLPSLQGLGTADAQHALLALGFQPRVQRVPSVFERETVFQQIPATGAHLRPGTVVQLVVGAPAGRARAAMQVKVPHVRGASEAEARELARSVGLRLVLRRRLAPERPVDQVISQRPVAGGRVPLGSVLRVELPRVSVVPVLLGLGAAEAARRLEAVGLAAAFAGDDVRALRSRVVDQDPEAGARIASGTAVRVVLRGRTAREHRLTRVPDLKGLGLAEAQRVLEEAGLVARPSFVRGGGPAGVTGQAPAPGTLTLRGTEVRFTIRRGR